MRTPTLFIAALLFCNIVLAQNAQIGLSPQGFSYAPKAGNISFTLLRTNNWLNDIDPNLPPVSAAFLDRPFNEQKLPMKLLNTALLLMGGVDNLSFFCRLEANRDRQAIMPARFRLGSVPYVDYLEQKNGARLPNALY
ncbi:MAG: hypothetical protein AAGG75_09155 [Bacteroidota bacterium]